MDICSSASLNSPAFKAAEAYDTAFELSAFNKLADNNRVKSLILIVPHLKV